MCIPKIKTALERLVPHWDSARYCVAFSGGLDSTALLYGMRELQREFGQVRLRAVHVNHHLLSQADEWMRHCQQVAAGLSVALTVRDVRVAQGPGISTEAAAREARYRALEEELQPDEYLLTAHHQDDQLETVLLQLMRGAGLAGLAAMPEEAAFGRGRHLRPLLGVARTELEEFLRAAAMPWVEDMSNEALQYDRNYLRRLILPVVRERWPAAAFTVARTAKHVAEAQLLLDELARIDLQGSVEEGGLQLAALQMLTPARARNLLRFWIRENGCRPPSTVKLHEVLRQMLESRADAAPRVAWGDVEIVRRRGRIHLQRVDRN